MTPCDPLVLHSLTINRCYQGVLPWGPGIGYHISRNVLSMSGLRVFGEPTYNVCAPLIGDALPESTTRIVCDLVCNLIVSGIST